jgi:hypothetical protein
MCGAPDGGNPRCPGCRDKLRERGRSPAPMACPECDGLGACSVCGPDGVLWGWVSLPERPPKSGGEAVTPHLLRHLHDRGAINTAALVRARDAFGRDKYGTQLRADNGRDPVVDAEQELGDLLMYLQQAELEGRGTADLVEPILLALEMALGRPLDPLVAALDRCAKLLRGVGVDSVVGTLKVWRGLLARD